MVAPLTAYRLGLLKHTAFLMGLSTTGTRAELAQAIEARVWNSRVRSTGMRIVSVDMGIRNLAYCVVDTPNTARDEHKDIRRRGRPLNVLHWSKRDLLLPAKADHESFDEPAVPLADGKKRRSTAKDSIPREAFTPPTLSKTAYEVMRDLISHQPDLILIERQRFRSGGQAAIQEWTVRVNMFESMLWACLHTMREMQSHSSIATPDAHAVSPALVANFWMAGKHLSLEPQPQHYSSDSVRRTSLSPIKLPRRKVEKKDKVAIARSWVEETGGAFPLSFEGGALETAKAFRENTATIGRKRRSEAELSMGKLDDLADCLLQAVAWVAWERNTSIIRQLLLQTP